jgi:hypothetical protein
LCPCSACSALHVPVLQTITCLSGGPPRGLGHSCDVVLEVAHQLRASLLLWVSATSHRRRQLCVTTWILYTRLCRHEDMHGSRMPRFTDGGGQPSSPFARTRAHGLRPLQRSCYVVCVWLLSYLDAPVPTLLALGVAGGRCGVACWSHWTPSRDCASPLGTRGWPWRPVPGSAATPSNPWCQKLGGTLLAGEYGVRVA